MERIDVLPDDILLEIFFYVDMSQDLSISDKTRIEEWQSLVHVCRRWRSLVFQSPRRLHLHLYCTPKTPAKDTLDIWPALPLLVGGTMSSKPGRMDNVIVALEQSNRIRQVSLLGFVDWQLEKVLAAMQVSFPELTVLELTPNNKTLLVIPIPDSFLGGSAPRLKYFRLSGILFPGLTNLLLSANHLTHLYLLNIPHSGYISPEVMVALLSTLFSLETSSLGFRSPQSGPGWESRSLPPPNRFILPALKKFIFKGVTEYLEELVIGIDTPQLDRMDITFFNQIDFDCPRLAQFLNRTPILTPDKGYVQFDDTSANIRLLSQTSMYSIDDSVIRILCCESDWQLSSIEQVCNFPLPPLSTVENLYIEHEYRRLVWKNDVIENTLWLQLLLPFTAVKNLYLPKEFAQGIAAALQELVGGRTEVLPSLQNIFVAGLRPSGPFQETIGQFVTARQLSGHPVAISIW